MASPWSLLRVLIGILDHASIVLPPPNRSTCSVDNFHGCLRRTTLDQSPAVAGVLHSLLYLGIAHLPAKNASRRATFRHSPEQKPRSTLSTSYPCTPPPPTLASHARPPTSRRRSASSPASRESESEGEPLTVSSGRRQSPAGRGQLWPPIFLIYFSVLSAASAFA